jgi:hypothetical protein
MEIISHEQRTDIFNIQKHEERVREKKNLGAEGGSTAGTTFVAGKLKMLRLLKFPGTSRSSFW